MKCTKCGADLPPGSKFCNNCGAPVPVIVTKPPVKEEPLIINKPPEEPKPTPPKNIEDRLASISKIKIFSWIAIAFFVIIAMSSRSNGAAGFFALGVVLSLLGIILGLMKPSLVHAPSRKHVLAIGIAIFTIASIGFNRTVPGEAETAEKAAITSQQKAEKKAEEEAQEKVRAEKAAKAEKEAKERKEAALATAKEILGGMPCRVDQVEKMKFYQPWGDGSYPAESAVYWYAVDRDGLVSMRTMIVDFSSGINWTFWTHVKFSTAEKSWEYDIKNVFAGQTGGGKNTQVVMGGKYETLDLKFDDLKQGYGLLVNGTNPIIRLSGEHYYKDYELTQEDIEHLKTGLALDNALTVLNNSLK